MKKIAKAPAAPIPDELAQPMAPTDTIEMQSPTGEVQQVAAGQAGTLAALGYKQVTQELTAAQAEHARYGEGIVNELEAAGLGILRGSTLGLSDLALRKINPQWADAAAKLKEYNPDASTAGELASFALPFLGGLGTAGKVVSKAGLLQDLVSGSGEAIGKIAEKIVGDNFAGHVARSALNAAAQGAVYQAAHNISEASLADKQLTAEAIFANTGHAAILGAGLGAAVPIIARSAQEVARSAPVAYAISAAAKQASKFLDTQRSAQLYSGAMSKPSLFRDTEAGEAFRGAVKNFWDEGAYKGGGVALDKTTGKIVQTEPGALQSQGEMYDRFARLRQDAGEGIGETLKQADEAASIAGLGAKYEGGFGVPSSSRYSAEERRLFGFGSKAKAGETPVFGWSEADQDIVSNQLAKWRKSSQITERDFERYNTATNEIAGDIDRATTLDALHDIRMGLDKRIGGENFKRVSDEDIEIIKTMRGILSRKISDGFDDLARRGIIEKTAAWKNLNRVFANASEILPHLDFQVARANSNVNVGGMRWRDLLATATGSAFGSAAFGPVGAVIGGGIGIGNRMLQTDTGLLFRAQLGEKLQKLAWAEQLTTKSADQIAKGIKGFLSKGSADRIAAKATGKLAAPIAYASPDRLPPSERMTQQQDWFAETKKQIMNVASNPEAFAAHQGSQIQGMADVAPELADALVNKQLQVYAYLAQAMPKNPAMPFSIANDKWQPADYEVQGFRKVVQVARAPLTILNDMRSGAVTKAQVDAVRTLYPKIYERILTEVQNQINEPDTPVSYNQRLRLSQLFPGADPRMAPQFIAAMQLPQGKPEPPSPHVSSRKPTFASRRQTASEKNEAGPE